MNTGTLDYLDAQSQNIKYPTVFVRPMTSPGRVINNANGTSIRKLNFEMYVLDNVRLSNESPTQIISRLERIGYDISSYFNEGPFQHEIDFIINNVTPVNEACNDRVYGWLLNVTISGPYRLTLCDAPFAS
jgi:hypothetical protein